MHQCKTTWPQNKQISQEKITFAGQSLAAASPPPPPTIITSQQHQDQTTEHTVSHHQRLVHDGKVAMLQS
jgi:hypothetical protein